jgi:uncharacterized coiled-coil protein SlyX
MRRSLSVVSVLLLLGGSVPGAELPVKKVILYKHGIGYFERGGEIPAGTSARLDFKSGEMNDVLKSLTVSDATGNSVAGVRYDSSLPLNEKLREFPFALRDKSPLVDFLDQLKGAEIELTVGSAAPVTGQIVGARVMPSEKPQTNTETVTILTSAGTIANFELAGVSKVKLADAELQRQLGDYLRSLNAARSREQKSVYIDSARDAARRLSVAYAIPMPVWKSSYRLVLDAGAQKKPVLEGWAIIDNTTNEDWTRVDLSVISGRPISFISRLYEPKLVQRQVAELAEEAPVGPTVYKGVAAAPLPGVAVGGMVERRQMNAQMRSDAAVAMMPAEPMQLQTSSVAVAMETREAGELFEYKFAQPVTVKRNESAMLPFVQQEIGARKLLIYTQGSAQENPFNAAELTNSTGKTLDGGPLSVYDGGVYAGEALVNTFKAGDKRLLSYALDLGTRVTEELEDGRERKLVQATAVAGTINTRHVTEVSRTYKVTNVDKKAKTLVLEHPIVPGYTLLSAKPGEQTANHYRFELKLTGEPAQTLVVKEQRVDAESILISSYGDDELEYLRSNTALSANAKRVLGEIAALRRQVADSENALKGYSQQIADANQDVERLRRNLSSLNGVVGQQERVQKYAADLAAMDGKIVTLRDQAAAETKKRDEVKRQLSAKIEGATF